MIPSKAVFTHWAFFLARKNLSRKLSWLNRAFIEVNTLNSFICNLFTVKLRTPWTPEKFQECWLCTGQSQKSSGYTNKSQNHKLVTVAVCGIVFSRLIGLFLATQQHSINISGVHGFVSFTVINFTGCLHKWQREFHNNCGIIILYY